jgi:hypothetical protein
VPPEWSVRFFESPDVLGCHAECYKKGELFSGVWTRWGRHVDETGVVYRLSEISYFGWARARVIYVFGINPENPIAARAYCILQIRI